MEHMEAMKKPRIEYIDLAKGICICLVVATHICEMVIEKPTTEYNEIENFLISFRMPLYFMLSGLFFKDYGGIKEFCRRKANKLLLPFAAFYLIGNIPWKVFGAYRDWEFINLCSWDWIYDTFFLIYPAGAIWFLLCLFMVGLLFYGLRSTLSNTFIMLAGSFALAFVSKCMSEKEWTLPLYLDTAMMALPFYSIGYIIRAKTDLLTREQSRLNIVLWLLCCLTVTALSIRVFGIDYINYYRNDYAAMPFPLVYVYGLLGIAIVLLTAKFFVRIPILSYVGRYSVVVLCTHQIIYHALHYAFRFLMPGSCSGPTYCSLLFVSCILISLPVIKYGIRYCPHIFAQKDLI